MGDIAAILPACFGLTGIRATKERGHFICKTGTGLTKIYKTTESHLSIKARFMLLEKIEAAGFPYIDKILTSTQNMPFVKLGQETFVMCQHVRSQDLDLNCPDHVKIAVQAIASFHKVAKGLGDTKTPEASPLTDVFSKNLTSLHKIKRQLSKNSRYSDFDMMFLKNIGDYQQYAEQSLDILEATHYLGFYQEAIDQQHICHQELEEENLLLNGNICYIKQFDRAGVGVQIADFAKFLYRYGRRSNRHIPLATLVDWYSSVLPISQEARQIILAYLTHPWQFMKVVDQHYSKKRGWTPIAMTTRMESLLQAQEAYNAFIMAGC